MIILIKYTDWLLHTRGAIEPKIEDKIKTISAARNISNLQDNKVNKVNKLDKIPYNSLYPYYVYYRNTGRILEECWVEVKVSYDCLEDE